MGDLCIYTYILLKSMLIQCEHFISKKIYYLEVHVQKTGQLHYILFGKLLNSVSDTFVIVVFKRLLSHHIKKGGKRILLTLKILRLLTVQSIASAY